MGGESNSSAEAKAQALALRALEERLEHEEADPDDMTITFAA